MKGLDTNILVRYLTQDDPVQTGKVNRFMRQAAKEEEMLFINGVVLCELVWVLETAYDFSRKDIIEILEHVIMTRQFEVESHDVVWLAIQDYRKHKADFSDCLIGRKNKTATVLYLKNICFLTVL